MNNWYIAAVKYTKEFTDGTLKRVNEKFLVNTMSFTEAEARIYKEVGEYVRGEFIVSALSKKQYQDIFNYDDSDSWFSAKVSYVTEDADTGKEKKHTYTYLVNANNLKEAVARMEESLKGMLATYRIHEIKESPILDVFPYEPVTEEEKEFESVEEFPEAGKDLNINVKYEEAKESEG